MATFDTAEDLARAFEQGAPTFERWRKVLRHVRNGLLPRLHGCLTSEPHRIIAGQFDGVVDCPLCAGSGTFRRTVKVDGKDVPIDRCETCYGSGVVDKRHLP